LGVSLGCPWKEPGGGKRKVLDINNNLVGASAPAKKCTTYRTVSGKSNLYRVAPWVKTES
jgi:hypothetical protein